MYISRPWGAELDVSPDNIEPLGLEAFESNMTQGSMGGGTLHPYFKALNVYAEAGEFYATIYSCKIACNYALGQQLAIWLANLRDTDIVNLTVLQLSSDVPCPALLGMLSAVANTKAKVNIRLDSIVLDTTAYFYLVADKITKGKLGALYIPSYAQQRNGDSSGPWRAMTDYYKFIVGNAVGKGILTDDEAKRLHDGIAVTIPDDRFPVT